MTPEEFRRHGHALVDWMADYMASVSSLPVRAQVAPGEVTAQLPLQAPEVGEPFEQIFADFQQIILPGMTHWQHPRFFAYFPANSSPPSVLGEMLTATLAAQCMLWQTSPAATELETRVTDWLRQLLGLPAGLAGVIQDSASSATLCAVLAARERATGWQVSEQGPAAGPPVTFYTSAEAHSSVEKAVRIAGVGRAFLRLIPVDAAHALQPAALQAAITADRAAGLRPAGVIACLGTTGVGACDPLAAIGEICAAEGLYLHVDAAWAGSALICPEVRALLLGAAGEGMRHVDSFVFNPHKWLLTNFDCSVHLVREPAVLTRTLSILPAYLQGQETGTVIDYRDWSVPLGRRFRALKLWFVLRSYGAAALREMIRDHIAWTAALASWIDAAPAFERVDGPRLALLNLRYAPPGVPEDALDALNRQLVEAVNADGRIYLTPNTVDWRATLRFSVGQASTREADVAAGWAILQELAEQLRVAALSAPQGA